MQRSNYRLLSRDGVEIRKMMKYISKTYVVLSLEDLYSLIAAHTRHLGPILWNENGHNGTYVTIIIEERFFSVYSYEVL